MARFDRSQLASVRIPFRLVLSYVVDWFITVCIAAIGAGFYKTTPNHRPFSPVDPSLSLPYVEKEKISTGVLVLIALIIPAIITMIVALVFTPGPTVPMGTSKSLIWRQKLWEWNTAWMGLGLALVTTFFFTEGMKNVFGKPRPDLLARCNLDPATVQQYALGGFGTELPLWNLLVSATACRQPDLSILNDGFASFPSGHASFSWAGMFYLSLYLCSKFAITIPYLLPASHSSSNNNTHSFLSSGTHTDDAAFKSDHFPHQGSSPTLQYRKQSAAPPVFLFILPIFFISLAVYVSGTRYSDFRHHGFDIISGALLGFGLAWASFRLYHLPVRRGAGWSWGPRSASRAWGIGVGLGSYVEDEMGAGKKRDLEAGNGDGNGVGIDGARRKPLANTAEGVPSQHQI